MTTPCANPGCEETFKPNPQREKRKFHSTDCKNDCHTLARKLGEHILFGLPLTKSERIKNVLQVLSDRKPHNATQLLVKTFDRNFTRAISELRSKGYEVKYDYKEKTWTLINGGGDE